MNLALRLLILIMLYAISVNVQSGGITYKIENEHAKAMYDTLTDAKTEGAAGRIIREGKSIRCWQITADVNDAQGRRIPDYDPKRYACTMYFDSMGLATPGN